MSELSSRDLTICSLSSSQLSMITDERDRLKHLLEESKSMKNDVGGSGITDERHLQVRDQILFISWNGRAVFLDVISFLMIYL